MLRPSEWAVIGLDEDSTPGDPVRVRALARELLGLSTDAGGTAAADVRRVGDAGWVGEAGDVFRAAIGELPGGWHPTEYLHLYWLGHEDDDLDEITEQAALDLIEQRRAARDDR